MSDGDAAVRLGYCTNVHPAETLDAVLRALRAFAAPVARRTGVDGVGLRLGATAVAELEAPERRDALKATLAGHGLRAFTVNGFPFGDFHAPRVKEAVYEPDWTTPERADYTRRVAARLVELLPDDDPFGTVSTAPVGFAPKVRGRLDGAADRMLDLVLDLERLAAETGRRVMVCVEPEPACALETIDDAVAFFRERLFRRAASRLGDAPDRAEERVRRHLGVCYDACHQAVLFEDVDDGFRRLAAAGVPVGKVQLSSALALPSAGAEALRALLGCAEPRFLHQATAR
ncbi:MAG TPA: metabolite traffic protein EboE, partial [Planctomycetota bacterium]|nr:metabolite traffic protein EboE [Planctomycetota bacterium]